MKVNQEKNKHKVDIYGYIGYRVQRGCFSQSYSNNQTFPGGKSARQMADGYRAYLGTAKMIGFLPNGEEKRIHSY